MLGFTTILYITQNYSWDSVPITHFVFFTRICKKRVNFERNLCQGEVLFYIEP